MFYVDVIVNDFEEIRKTSFPGKEGVSSTSLIGPTTGGKRGKTNFGRLWIGGKKCTKFRLFCGSHKWINPSLIYHLPEKSIKQNKKKNVDIPKNKRTGICKTLKHEEHYHEYEYY